MSRRSTSHPLFELTAARVREFLREPEAVRLLAAANPATMDRATARELAELLRLWADGEGAAHV